MTGLAPYLHFPGTAREALVFYAGVFGGTTEVHTYAEFGREDGPADAVAHGLLVDSAISLYAADAARGEPSYESQGLMLSLLGTAPPPTMHDWFAGLADGGTVVDALQERAWGASDGQVIDRHGVHWLIGYLQEGAT